MIINDRSTYLYYKAVKLSLKCAFDKCTERDITFHHVVPANKIDSVSTIARNATLQELVTELRKCVPLCAVHHKRVHSGYHRGWLVGRFNNGEPTWDDSMAKPHLVKMYQRTGGLHDNNTSLRVA